MLLAHRCLLRMSGFNSPTRQVHDGIGERLRLIRSRLQSREAALDTAAGRPPSNAAPAASRAPSRVASRSVEEPRGWQRPDAVAAASTAPAGGTLAQHAKDLSSSPGAPRAASLSSSYLQARVGIGSTPSVSLYAAQGSTLAAGTSLLSRPSRANSAAIAGGLFASQLPVRVGSAIPPALYYGSGVRTLSTPSDGGGRGTVTATSGAISATGIPAPRDGSRLSASVSVESSVQRQLPAPPATSVAQRSESFGRYVTEASSFNSNEPAQCARDSGPGLSAPATTAGAGRSSSNTDSYPSRAVLSARSVGAAYPVPSEQFQRSPRGLVGLTNLGNTCFMNSVLACLSNVPPLARYFASRKFEADINTSARGTHGRLAAAYGELMQAIWASPARPGAVETPSRLKQIVGTVASRFMGYDQQDAQELLRFLLDALHDDVNRVRRPPAYVELTENPRLSDADMSAEWWRNYTARNDSELAALFAGQLKTSVVCAVCKTQSRAFDPVWDWSLPIPKAGSLRDRFEPGGGGLALTDCMKLFVEEEYLSGADAFFCRRCGQHEPCYKRTVFFRAPKVLVVHLKRFNFSFVRRSKITTSISFPLHGLDIRPFMDPSSPFASEPGINAYRCVAVSNHSGSLGGGHYTAHALNCDDNSWYLFNDSRVSKASSGHISGADAYLLFFVHDG
jgi:ubiquitin C-terminal hydrolase